MSRFFDFLVRWGEATFESSRDSYIKRFNLEEYQIEDTAPKAPNSSNKKTD